MQAGSAEASQTEVRLQTEVRMLAQARMHTGVRILEEVEMQTADVAC